MPETRLVRPGEAQMERSGPPPTTIRRGPHLHARLGQAQALTQFLPHEGVGIMRLVEQPLQFVQLLQRKVGAAPSLFQLGLSVLVLGFHVLTLVLAFVKTCRGDKDTQS